MRPPLGYVFPDFLNLGIAPPAPRGALAVAPRAKLVPAFTLGDLFTRNPSRVFAVAASGILPAGVEFREWPDIHAKHSHAANSKPLHINAGLTWQRPIPSLAYGPRSRRTRM